MKLLRDRIRKILDDLADQGVDQMALARAAGVTKGTVSQWLSGAIKSIKLGYAQGIAAEFGYSADWLVLGTGDPKPSGAKAVKPAPSTKTWPFQMVDEEAVRGLAGQDLARLEGAMLLTLAQLGIGVQAKVAPPAKTTANAAQVADAFPEGPVIERQPARVKPATSILEHRRHLRLSRATGVIAPTGADAGDRFVALPDLRVRLAAGAGREHFAETRKGSVLMSREFLESFKLPIDRMSVLYADGKSMQPDIPDGAPMLFYAEEIRTLATADRDRVYGINRGGEMLVKMLAKGIAGNWVARSINKDFPDIPLDRDDGVETRIIGYVLWTPPFDPLAVS